MYLCYGPFQLHAPFRPGALNMCAVSTPFLGDNAEIITFRGHLQYTFMFFTPGRFISQKKSLNITSIYFNSKSTTSTKAKTQRHLKLNIYTQHILHFFTFYIFHSLINLHLHISHRDNNDASYIYKKVYR